MARAVPQGWGAAFPHAMALVPPIGPRPVMGTPRQTGPSPAVKRLRVTPTPCSWRRRPASGAIETLKDAVRGVPGSPRRGSTPPPGWRDTGTACRPYAAAFCPGPEAPSGSAPPDPSAGRGTAPCHSAPSWPFLRQSLQGWAVDRRFPNAGRWAPTRRHRSRPLAWTVACQASTGALGVPAAHRRDRRLPMPESITHEGKP